jgi:hypothetical protein
MRQCVGGVPRGFCIDTARIWQFFWPHLEQRNRFSTPWRVVSHPQICARRLGYVERSCPQPLQRMTNRYCPNSSDSRSTLKSPPMGRTVYNHRLLIPLHLAPTPRHRHTFNSMYGLEKEFPFCCNPDCALYVRAGDPGVVGSGNWAEFSDGRIVGHGIYSGVYLCDPCGQHWQPVLTFSVETDS